MSEEVKKEVEELQAVAAVEEGKADAEVIEEGLINREKKEHEVNQPEHFSIRFQIIATLIIVACAGAGIGVGIIMSNAETNADIVSWFGLPGDLFIRALTCVVLPLVFVNVILAVIQMIEAGKAGAVGKYTVLVYLLSTFVASVEGLISVLIFQSQFSADEQPPAATFVQIQCPGGELLSVQENGALVCDDAAEGNTTQFEIDNVNNFFVTSGDAVDASITFSQTLQDGIFRKLVPSNIVAEFANGGFVGVIMFGIVFGAAAQFLQKKPVLLIDFLQDVNDILARIITWVIMLTPIAVFSLIAAALASQDNLAETFSDIGILILAALCAFIAHIVVVYPLFFFLITKSNPYTYLRYMVPAQVFAFSCASSAATLPVTMRCITETGLVPDSIRDFVLPIGATINMDGAGLYFPAAIVFLATTSGLKDDLDAAAYFLILLVSTIGSAGAAPVPNAGLVLIITAFNTVFSTSGTPGNFAIIVGIDWLMDRFQTALNVTGDTMAARIITHLSGLNTVDGVTSEMPVSQVED